MEIKRLFDIIDIHNPLYLDVDDALSIKINDNWISYSSKQYRERSKDIAISLIELGVKKGDKIATISTNRPEWNFVDMAVMQIGAIHVPINPNTSIEDFDYILNHAEVRLIFIEEKKLLLKLKRVIAKIPSLSAIYTFDKVEGYETINDLLTIGSLNNDNEGFLERKKRIDSEDVATIVYDYKDEVYPKGVMLTHANIINSLHSLSFVVPKNINRMISKTPLSLIYERVLNYYFQLKGFSIYYPIKSNSIIGDIKDISSQVLYLLPDDIDKIYNGLINKSKEDKGVRKKILFWAIKLGTKNKLRGKQFLYKTKLKIADKLIYSKWREELGGELQMILTSNGYIKESIINIFNAARIPVYKSYGTTETASLLTVNSNNSNNNYAIGFPLEHVNIKIADDGEILVQGEQIMQGYFKQETSIAIDDDGWLHTGDLGRIEPDGQLMIIGRKKVAFKTIFGKIINPEHIEKHLLQSPFIDRTIVLGKNQKHIAALIVPNYEFLNNWKKEKEINIQGTEILEHPKVKIIFDEEVKKVNTQLGDAEKILHYKILNRKWTVEGGELTPTFEIRRKNIISKYKDLINNLFE